MILSLTINGENRQIAADCDEFLADTLRKAGYLSVKQGCNTTSCGLCTVWLDGLPVLSCAVLSARAQGRQITTLEGVQEQAREFAEFLLAEGADQCGFCAPGFVMTVLAMKRDLKNPTEEEMRQYLNGNLCRCTGYMGQMRAVRKYMGVHDEADKRAD